MPSAYHLLLRPSGYYFRLVVPGDLRHVFRKRELKYSLKTSLKQLASSRAMVLAGLVKGLIISLRRGIQHKGIKDTINKFLMLALGKTPIVSHMDHTFVPNKIVQEDSPEGSSAYNQDSSMYQSFVPKPVEPAIPTLEDVIKQFLGEGDQTEGRWTPNPMSKLMLQIMGPLLNLNGH